MASIIIPIVIILLTIVVYQGFQFIQAKSKLIWLNPMLLSIIVIIPFMSYWQISFDTYMLGGQWLNGLLEPAVVALGFPLYQQLNVIKRNWLAISLILLISSVFAVIISFCLSMLLIANQSLAVSMALKSITTPIALELSTLLAGMNAITALAIIIAGLIGAVSGVSWLNLLGVRDKTAQGLAIGAASHVLGTATVSKDCQHRGAYGALALIFSALFTAIIAPLLLPFIAQWLM